MTLALRTFARNRIRGVSFRRATSSLPGATTRSTDTKKSLNDPFFLQATLAELQKTEPRPFRPRDIQRLMADQGRQEIHALVSDTVDHLAQLRQLERSLLRFAPEHETKRQLLDAESAEDARGSSLDEMRIEVLRLQRLWKMRLEILEMITMAQNSLRHSPSAPQEKRLQQAATSARPKK